jgi:hypothetical protein
MALKILLSQVFIVYFLYFPSRIPDIDWQLNVNSVTIGREGKDVVTDAGDESFLAKVTHILERVLCCFKLYPAEKSRKSPRHFCVLSASMFQ